LIDFGDPPAARRSLPSPATPLSLDGLRQPPCRGGTAGLSTARTSLYNRGPTTASGEGAVAGQPNVSELNPLAELLAATAGGDRAAFHQLYHLSSPRLFGTALCLLRRRELAEEVVQEAFVSIWHKARQYRSERGNALAWMTRIVRNRAIDRLRAERREPHEVASLDEVSEARLESVGAGVASRDHGEGSLRDCLEQLKNAQQDSIVLAYYYGLTHEELAARLDAPLGTVKSWVRRGLLQLKDCLEQ
jgi:RNA polymerase sigma-70 factor (ECF subfamily)